MREIKFRAWDEERKRMYNGDEIEAFQDLNAWLSYGGLAIYRIEEGEYTELKPLQYTGLDDKNGVEIFEGDITLRNGSKFQIKKEIGSYMLVKCDEDTDMYEEFKDCWNDHVYPMSQFYWNNNDCDNYLLDLEVIGNIYEHPHLLENNQ